ncbi:short-chain fatty acid transporter [Papillibacter cinnamivorans]|uniref:Short-chain fatty acids transporter n=1 Tax=Papillibacter cinnamivorans DSM 12816 TaxID=1122930 RepID=A0A1W1ZHP1_9FIRM|nr:short-chain fatty acids transporter [Papillibacter cinnamivorans DSM 12816]
MVFKKFTNGCVNLVNKYLPDAFLFAIVLTIIVFLAGMGITQQTPMAMVKHWGTGFWSLLSFSMQMVLVLVLGTAMAKAPVFERLLTAIAMSAKTPGRAVVITAVVATVACWLNWGFGLIIGVLIAKEMAKRVKGVDYRLLIATGYAGMIVWHGGISGSIPLQIASGSAESLAQQTAGALTAQVPTSETIFAPFNLIICLLFLIFLPLVAHAMMPTKENTVTVDPRIFEEPPAPPAHKFTPAENFERNRVMWIITLALGYIYIVYNLVTTNFNLGLNIVNMIFLFVGLTLHGNLRRYIDALMASASTAGGIILQFPFYAGIMGMMTGVSAATGTSLAQVISNAFVSIATPVTFPLFTYLSAGIVNLFVPSGGGQWAVQGPIMMPAGVALGVKPAVTAMGIAWGDAWTNMIQPFWALPALGIAGLSARDIMGYCVIVLIMGGIITSAVFLLFGGMGWF